MLRRHLLHFFLCAGLLLALALLSACSSSPSANQSAGQRQFLDEAGRNVTLPLRVDRFVSLAPNLTEIAYAVGAGDRLVGNTTYCDYPAEAKQVAKVGDTLQPNIERILALRPQLVLVSTASQLEAFTKQLNDHGVAVFVTDPQDLEGVFRSIENTGKLLSQEAQARVLLEKLRARTVAVETAVRNQTPVTVFYQLSNDPLYTAGRDSFVTDLIKRAGGKSVTAEVPGAWPKYSVESALAAKPEAIVLPTGGSMGTANTEVASQLKNAPAVVKGRVYKINDDYLARPGPRAIDGLEELARALHPGVFQKSD